MTILYSYFRHWLLVMISASALCLPQAHAADAVSPQALRAALLFNYIKFTEWPAASAGDPQMLVCIATNDPTQFAAIKTLEGRSIRKQTIAIATLNNQADCNVVYVDSGERWKEARSRLAGNGILTVGAYADFLADGGMIEVSLHEEGARFDISQREAKRAGLRFYPQLLRLAHGIIEY